MHARRERSQPKGWDRIGASVVHRQQRIDGLHQRWRSSPPGRDTRGIAARPRAWGWSLGGLMASPQVVAGLVTMAGSGLAWPPVVLIAAGLAMGAVLGATFVWSARLTAEGLATWDGAAAEPGNRARG